MNQADFNSLCKILQDEKTMYAYEGAFNDAEVQEWLDKQLSAMIDSPDKLQAVDFQQTPLFDIKISGKHPVRLSWYKSKK